MKLSSVYRSPISKLRSERSTRARYIRLGVIVAALIALPIALFWRVEAAVTFRAAATGNNAGGSTTLSIGMPSGTVQNDVMIAVISVRGGTGVTITPPSGWNLINSATSTTVLKSSTYYKVAGASEAGPYSFGFSSSQKASGVISGYSGVDTTAPVNANDFQTTSSDVLLNAPVVTTTVPNTVLVKAYSTAINTTISAGSGATLRGQDASTGTANTCTTSAIEDEGYTDVGTTFASQADANAAAVNIGHTVALNPLVTTYAQSAYRWYANADGVQPGSALASENTSYTLTSPSNPIRLRMQQDISQFNLSASSQAFTLQYANSTSGPWYDVGISSWWNSSWTARRKITLDNIASSENLTNFPIRVSLSSSNIDYAKTQNSGQDIRFVDPDGTVLKYEIEKWDEAGTSEVWVKVPQIDAATNTDYIYMYYGNTSASDAQDVANVWSNGYKAVWHSKEASGTSIADSTGNGNTGSLNNGAALTTSGKIGNANSFDGINDVMNAGSSASLDDLVSQGGGGVTVSAWVNSVDSDYWSQIAAKAQDAGVTNGWLFEVDDDSDRIDMGASYDGTTFTRSAGTAPGLNSYNTWQYYAFTKDSSDDFETPAGIGLYVNGVSSWYDWSGSGTTRDSDASYDFTSGCDAPATDQNECLEGKIDELRVSNVVRSPQWIEAEYRSTNNDMNSFGSEESYASIGTIGWYNNAAPAHGAAITSTLLTGSDVLESYQEQNSTPVNPNAISTGQQGEWDFSLDFTNAISTTYYFRIVKADHAPLSTYTYYPTIVTSFGLTLDQMLRGGGGVLNGTKSNLTW